MTKDNYSYDQPDIKIKPILQDETNSSIFITNIIEKTRSKIKYDTSTYNFSEVDVHRLEDLVMESGGQPLRSVVISTWRSGSNFLGDLITHVFPSTYYTREPFIMYGYKQFRKPKEVNKALNIFKRMLNCNYGGFEDYFEFVRTTLMENGNNTIATTSDSTKQLQYSTSRNVKTRIKTNPVIIQSYNVKVLLLVRDPRGVMQSRLHRLACMRSSECNDPSLLCADMVSDYMAAGRLLQHYPDKLMVMRFEELALQPNITTDRILKFLKTQRTQAFDDFLQSHTNVEVTGPHSTSRVSRNVPYKWRTALDFNYVNEIQMACSYAMNLWGYKMAHNETHMTSKDFNPIDDYTIQ